MGQGMKFFERKKVGNFACKNGSEICARDHLDKQF